MIVVDTSAILASLVERPPNEMLLARLADDGSLHAPHLIDIEFLHALRRMVRARDLDESRAVEARDDYGLLRVTRYPHMGLADRVWELRRHITAYDAAFISLAEALGAPLITLDRRLARAGQHGAEVEVFGASRS